MGTACTATMLQSHGLPGRRAEKLFDGREITSDGGAMLRREVDRASTEPRNRTSPFSMGPGSCGWPIPFGDARVEVGCPRKLAYHWIRTEHRPFRWWGRRTSEHRPFHTRWRGLGRERALHGPRLTWGCPPLDHSTSLDEGDRHHGQGVDNPPTAVPRADVGCAIESSQGRSAPPRVKKTSPDSKGRVCRTVCNRTSPFSMHRGRGLPGTSPTAAGRGSAEPSCPPRLKRAMFCSVDTWGSVAVLQKYC